MNIGEERGNRAGVAQSLHQIGMIYHLQKKYPEAFEYLLTALAIFTELQSRHAQIAANNLSKLRDDWGEEAFEEAMRKR